MTETDIVRKIRKYVEGLGGKVYKMHGGPFSHAGAPDLIGSVGGPCGWCGRRPRSEKVAGAGGGGDCGK